MKISTAYVLRSYAEILAEQEKDAGLVDWLKNLKDMLEKASHSIEERARLEEYLKKNPQLKRNIEEMMELMPTIKPGT